MSFTPREARAIIRKQVGRVPEGEEIRHLNIMPMMDMMTILLVAFIAQAAASATAVIAGTVVLPASVSQQPMPETASTLVITRTAIVVEGRCFPRGFPRGEKEGSLCTQGTRRRKCGFWRSDSV
jgi:hypothetical protein